MTAVNVVSIAARALGTEFRERGRVEIDLPGFSGNIDDPHDAEKIDVTLKSWGAHPDGGGWKDEDGGWIVPVAASAGQ